MNRIFLFLLAAAFIFSFDVRVLADEGHSHDQKMEHENMNHDDMNMNIMDHEGMDMDHESSSDHEGMDMDHESGSDHEGMNMDHGSGSDMEGMDMEGGSHEHHGPVVETPPNYKILGTYGAVNLAFILIGIWNKWFRRNGGVNNGNA
ncbi:hypothetical protein [Neobacillus sp. PS2-9]|uniref:hypothetical protein n=1 Tax=Neobacillus sp. PS2-9 TaxID=3070676 RepID=UPI0027DFA6D9|nr:hypothetical protein [Neobacillus sp. PS2-9]WML59084.1 hypothetical protein RCG25_04595 [Neobacillus sp. PS2-9]